MKYVFKIESEGFPEGLAVKMEQRIHIAFKISGIEQPKDGFAKICGYLPSIRNHVCIWCLLGTIQGVARQKREKQTKLAIVKVKQHEPCGQS